MAIDKISLTIFQRRLEGITEEMTAVLRKTAYSPNIKERADFSCAIFDSEGKMLVQAEAIPVHLGSMPFVAKPVIKMFDGVWKEGDAIVTNSPRGEFGGTHLPDITLLAPVFKDGKCTHVVANRAHHSDVGGQTPGSLPAKSTEIYQEGLIIPPVRLYMDYQENKDMMRMIMENVRTPIERRGDLRAQYSSLMLGVKRLQELSVSEYGWQLDAYQTELLQQARLATQKRLMQLPNQQATYTDYLDSNGITDDPVAITCTVAIPGDGSISFDFSGSDQEQEGNCNCPLSVTTSACYYVVRLVTGTDVPSNAGCFESVSVIAPVGSVVNPTANVSTSSANTETSSRLVDVIMGAMAQIIPLPSASQGTMNNIIIGNSTFSIYETIGGGTGGGPDQNGISAIQSHMTNTENTPVEALELAYPLRVIEYSIRQGSGGQGKFSGGDGIIREIEVLEKVTITLQSERRKFAPTGQLGGKEGKIGRNVLLKPNQLGSEEETNYETILLKGRETIYNVDSHTRIRIETPGGGGYGMME